MSAGSFVPVPPWPEPGPPAECFAFPIQRLGQAFFPILVYVSDYLHPTDSESLRSYLCGTLSGGLSSLLQYVL